MTKSILRIALAVLLFASGYYAARMRETVAYAQRTVAIPKTWGHCVGTIGGSVVLEDASGTIRIVNWETGIAEVQINRN
jgi:hypothetical protein